jgi:Skp family chaperone for outer membrane proteins
VLIVSFLKHRVLPTGLALLVLAATAFAQGPARPGPAAAPPTAAAGTNVAVIDINEVFEHHQRFKAAMEDIKNDIKNYEASVLERRKQGTALGEQLKDFQPGTPEYKEREASLAKLSADMQVEMALKKKDFMDREAKVYYTAYQEVLEQVTAFSQANRIGLVLRFNGEQIDPQERNSVLQGVNRAIVYQRNLNITEPIIERLNRGVAPAAAVGARPGLPPRR